MRTAVVFTAVIAGVSAFGVPPTISTRAISQQQSSTTLFAFLTPEERSTQIARWSEIRSMTAEEASSSLSGDELEAYNRYYAEMREGVLKMQELATIMMKGVEPPRIKPKSKGQRKRDAWARVQARAAANAQA